MLPKTLTPWVDSGGTLGVSATANRIRTRSRRGIPNARIPEREHPLRRMRSDLKCLEALRSEDRIRLLATVAQPIGCRCTTYLVPKTCPKPIAHVSAPAFINNQSPKLILKLLRRKLLRIVILKRAPSVLSGRWWWWCSGARGSRRRGHRGRRSWRKRRKGCRRLGRRDTRR